MRVLVLGGGMVGQGIAYALKNESDVTIADYSSEKLLRLKKDMGVDVLKVNAVKDPLAPVMKDFDVVSGALPGRLGMKVIKEACKAEVDLVDNSFMEEDFYDLEKEVKKAGITVVPDAGVAPGLSNAIVGRIAADYGYLDNVDIKVGGLPERNIPPIGYKVVFSPMDTLDEFTRKVQIIKNGKIIETEPGEGLEYFFVNGLGSLEAFYTNGLRSLLKNIKTNNMVEKTVRYRGHIEKMTFLKDLGLLDESKVDLNGKEVVPKELLASLFLKNLSFPDIKDILYMEIRVTPAKSKEEIIYKVFDKEDSKTGFTAMTRTTGFTNAAFTHLILNDMIKEKGIVPPEIVGGNAKSFNEVIGFLSKMGVSVTGSKN
ncbi:MAG: saccharopine dehydrogenase NADP-binding domain-containing protein [Thermoplasmatales archaeon]|nr:saccharopine dehydrogenase NADP-binding domain-containing protein [Candidatus Thermoplasmatota archaeon]MDA8055523.1 saccharopine dehydrogenase NADP-binding domain-containing protein [Thermoplasmatales archaeon]